MQWNSKATVHVTEKTYQWTTFACLSCLMSAYRASKNPAFQDTNRFQKRTDHLFLIAARSSLLKDFKVKGSLCAEKPCKRAPANHISRKHQLSSHPRSRRNYPVLLRMLPKYDQTNPYPLPSLYVGLPSYQDPIPQSYLSTAHPLKAPPS